MSPPDRRRLSASSKQGGLPPHGEIPRRTGRDDRCCTYRGGRSRLPRPSTRAEYAHLAGALACHLSVAKKLFDDRRGLTLARSEEHTSELQSQMRHSYAVFCLKNKKNSN